jgi:hypothetical protein
MRIMLASLLGAVPSAFAQAQPDGLDNSNLYPSRYVAACKPAPIVGCVCSTDSHEQISVFAGLAAGVKTDVAGVRDPDYWRMIEWLRRSCTSLAPQTNLH